MDPLAWLGLRSPKETHANLNALHEAVAQLLPDDEPVVLRYIVIVAVLLTRVAHADGVFLQCELDRLRKLFQHIDRMPVAEIDHFCDLLHERVPKLSEAEHELCFIELKSLLDATERLQVMRLLASQATADGDIAASEHSTLSEIAEQLGVPTDSLADIEREALQSDDIPVAPDSLPPPPSRSRAPASSKG